MVEYKLNEDGVSSWTKEEPAAMSEEVSPELSGDYEKAESTSASDSAELTQENAGGSFLSSNGESDAAEVTEVSGAFEASAEPAVSEVSQVSDVPDNQKNMMTLEAFEDACEVVTRVTQETKLIHSKFFSDMTGNKVYFKPENMQLTGAFKLRGAYYTISTLTDEERARGLVTASAGNHAQGVAYAAQCYGCKAVICMPVSTPLIKIERTKAYGAEVVLYGNVYDEACEKALELSKEYGYTMIHPFDDLRVATGQGSISMEIIQNLPLVDYILVPIGGGGLAAGVATLAKMLRNNIKVIGVEPEGAACMKASLEAGHVVSLPNVNTIADGTAVKTPGEHIFPYIQKYLDDIITIPDHELVTTFLDMVENHKMIVENSGLLSVAALKHLGVKNKRVVSILSGGNMDVITMSSVVQNGLLARDRIFTLSILLPDKPGELARVATVIANEKGNVIKLDHNQFINTNRNYAVELKVTLEAFGPSHKLQIMDALKKAGYDPKVTGANL